MRASEGEQRGEADEQECCGHRILCRQRSGGRNVKRGVSHWGQKARVSNRRSISPCQSSA
jgi:hypothetical protein